MNWSRCWSACRATTYSPRSPPRWVAGCFRSIGIGSDCGHWTYPAGRVSLGELRWHLDLPWWRRDGTWFQVTPREFLAEPQAHPQHAERVANADLSYPLHVIRRRERWLILDGIHRLVKAEILGLDRITVLPLDPADLVKILRHKRTFQAGAARDS